MEPPENNNGPKADAKQVVYQENEKKLDGIYTRLKILDLLHSIILITGIIFAFIQDDLINVEKEIVPTFSEVLRGCNSVSIIPLRKFPQLNKISLFYIYAL